jgi:uncharacterized protein
MMDNEFIEYMAKLKMPFGKYKGYYVTDLPDFYLVWFRNKGFPPGKLGKAMGIMHELQSNGYPDELKYVFKKLRYNEI